MVQLITEVLTKVRLIKLIPFLKYARPRWLGFGLNAMHYKEKSVWFYFLIDTSLMVFRDCFIIIIIIIIVILPV